MKTTVHILLLNIVLTITSFAQTTYYVDATNGHDTYEGTTPTTAWKTINKLNQQSFLAGDSILFKRNESWFGTRLYIENISGVTNMPIVYGAYGSGAKPIISSVVPHPHSWINTATNIWKATNPPENHPNRMLINGVEKLRANIANELDGITFFWLYNDSNDLYIYSNTDPNNFVFEYSTDFPMIVGSANYITISDLNIQGGWTGIFINTSSTHIHLDSLTIGKYCREGIIISSGSSNPSDDPKNIIIEKCILDAHFNFDYSSAGSYDGSSDRGSSDGFRASILDTAELKNCFFKNWGHASISLVNTHVSHVSIHDNYLSSPDICYGGRLNVDDAHDNEIYNNQIINTSVQSQINGQYNHYHHNIFYATTNSPLKPTIIDAAVELQGYANDQVIGNIYENNLFINTEGPGFRISGNNDNPIHNNIIKNNIIYNCGTLINGESLVVEEDLYEATYNNTFQNNLIDHPTTGQTCNFRGAVYDVDGFDNQSGTDGYVMSNNISGNPLFLDVNNNDYHLQAGSPCIDAGTNSIALFDLDGNDIPYPGSAPDIGVYEFQANLSSEDDASNNNLMIYPNPTKDDIQISGNKKIIKNITLLNSNGKIVLNDIKINEFIDLSDLPKGIYFILFETTNGFINKKIILIE
jgi:hypothetical protein